jgi:hypothetical protein
MQAVIEQSGNLEVGRAMVTASRDWRRVDSALRAIAVRRAGLDAEEARWLREAEAVQIWRPLGMVSAIDYMERVLGYAPRTAQDRLRVARALGALPRLEIALAGGELAFSAVRELTRVATPANEAEWIAAARGQSLRQIEDLVADHQPGDGPSDPKDPRARTHVVRFELSAETFARLRQTRQALESERGRALAENELVAAMCEAALATGNAEPDDGRAKYQIAMTVCERCKQGWQDGAGVAVPIRAAAVDRALCDAQQLGSLDGDAPARAYQDVAPSVARFVRRRDHGRCRVPGCRSSRGLETHHIVHREHGGGHEASNLILLCSSCHAAHHDGILTITGTADALTVSRPGDAAADQPSTLDLAIARARRPHPTSRVAEADRIGLASSAHVGATDAGPVIGPSVHVGATDAGPVIGPSVHVRATDAGPVIGASAHVSATDAGPVTGPSVHVSATDAGPVIGASAHVSATDAERITPAPSSQDAATEAERICPVGLAENVHAGATGGVPAMCDAPSAHASADRAAQVEADDSACADREGVRRRARSALREMGWSSAIVRGAIAAAEAKIANERDASRDADERVKWLIIEALRACPRPRGPV